MNENIPYWVFFLLISVLVGIAVTSLVIAAFAAANAARQKQKENLSSHDAERLSPTAMALRLFQDKISKKIPLKQKIQAVAELFGAMLNETSIGRSLLAEYDLAGRPRDLTDDAASGLIFYPLVAFGLFFAVVAAFAIPPLILAAPLLSFGVGYFIVRGWITAKRTSQITAVSSTMPYVIDSLVAAMRAGASFIMAADITAKSYDDAPIGRELADIIKSINQGTTTADAVKVFKDRFPMLPVVDSFCDDVINSTRYGTPLAETLEQSSARYKNLRIQSAREAAGKAKVKILAPGVIILFGSLLLLFGPFVVKFFASQNSPLQGPGASYSQEFGNQ